MTSSFLIGGISAIVMLLVGFLILKEPFTWMRLLAIGLILAGIFLLQQASGYPQTWSDSHFPGNSQVQSHPIPMQ